jgi:hypothetical protein
MEENQVIEKQEVEVKEKISIGKVSGLRFIKAWGFYLEKFQNESGNKELVMMAMLEDFPKKEGSITKWTEWYKSYYNMGKINVVIDKIKWVK